MEFHWYMFCWKCNKLLGYYSIESEYEPDGWTKTEFECLECGGKK